jgi:hypothetical protein
MEFNSNQYSLNRNIITPVQSYQNSQIYQSNINYESQSTFPNTGLSQSVNLLNNNFPTQPNKEDNEINVLSDYRNTHLDINQINSGVEYYNQPNHYISTNQNNTIVAPQKQVYTENIIKTSYTTSYTAPTKIPMKVLPTKYLPNKIIEDNQDFNIKEFAKVFPIKDYHNNLNTESNTQIIQKSSKEYFSNNIIDTTPNNPVPINNVNSINEFTSIDNVNSIEGVTPITPITNISYATEEYKTTNYKTQTQEEFQTVNYGLVDTKTKEDRNMNIYANNENIINNEYLINDYVEMPAEKKEITTNTEVIYENENKNINKEYYIKSPVHEEPKESFPHAFIHHSPTIEKKADVNILSPIQSPLSNFETQSFNQESTLYKLENELFNLRAENESYKKQIQELDRYKAEAAQAKELREQVEQLSPLKDQLEEIASLKAQLTELNELKLKIKELENLRNQVEQMTSNSIKKRKFKTLGKKGKKTKITKKKLELNENLESKKEELNEPEEKNTDLENNKDIVLEEKTEQTFVNGDIIQSIEELELIIRKINKASKKMTLNLIYKATADTDRAADFHKKCDEAKNTLVLVETDKGKRFGGYTSVSWKGKCIEKMDKEAFVFSLDKMKIYENIPGEKAIGCYPKFGPVFLGCQIRIYDRAFQKGGTTYEKGLNYKTTEDFELNGGERLFKVKDIEVYEVIPQ